MLESSKSPKPKISKSRFSSLRFLISSLNNLKSQPALRAILLSAITKALICFGDKCDIKIQGTSVNLIL